MYLSRLKHYNAVSFRAPQLPAARNDTSGVHSGFWRDLSVPAGAVYFLKMSSSRLRMRCRWAAGVHLPLDF